MAREERAVLTYLVGELWRRVGDGGQATKAELNNPAGLAVHPNGLLITDAGSGRVRTLAR